MTVSGVSAWGLAFLSPPALPLQGPLPVGDGGRASPVSPPPAPVPARAPACSLLASRCPPVAPPWLLCVLAPSFLSRAGGGLVRQDGVEAAPTPLPSTAAFLVSVCQVTSAWLAQWQAGPRRWASLLAAALPACGCWGGHQPGPMAPTPFPASKSFGPRPGSGHGPGCGQARPGGWEQGQCCPRLRGCVG